MTEQERDCEHQAAPACFIIAEIGQAHDGSLGQAHAYIDAVARTGASAVKFQTHIAAEESSRYEQFRVNFSYQDKTRYDYWQRMEFTPDQWLGLKEHAQERGLMFMSSAFSLAAVELLTKMGVKAWKVGSGELGSAAMLSAMAATGKPMYISTGMSGYQELDGLTQRLRDLNANFTLMQCMTAYPSTFEHVGLNVLGEYRTRYNCPVGLSDHSATIFPALGAVTLGASAIEVHVTFSREMFGPDAKASLTIDELSTLVTGVRAIETMHQNPVDKDAMARELAPIRALFAKSACARRDLSTGHHIAPDDFVMLKPGGGMPEADFTTRVGQRLARPVSAGDRFQPEDFDA